ncbi:hypothetical protein VD0002_g5328 [Verticillium dahliae]|nr:hypothetical protein VD0002_g5328 [Verticillium dahliae]
MPSPGAVYTGTGASPGVPQYSQQAALNPAPQPPSNQESTSEIKPSKPQAPKVQYKIPEKVTPVPLPAMYRAARSKTGPAPTPTPGPTKTAPQARPQTPEVARAPTSTLPSPTSNGALGSTSSAQSPNAQSKTARISETPVPLPHQKAANSTPRTKASGAMFGHASTASPTKTVVSTPDSTPAQPLVPAQTSTSPDSIAAAAQQASAAYTQNGTPSRPPSQPTQVSNRAAVETPVPLPRLPVKVTPVPLPPQALQVLSAGNPVSKPSGYTGEAISETPILPPVRAPMATTQTSAEVDDMDRGRGVH